MNFCLFCVGTVQTSRILMYNAAQKGSVTEGLKEMGSEVTDQAKSLEQNVEKEVKA